MLFVSQLNLFSEADRVYFVKGKKIVRKENTGMWFPIVYICSNKKKNSIILKWKIRNSVIICGRSAEVNVIFWYLLMKNLMFSCFNSGICDGCEYCRNWAVSSSYQDPGWRRDPAQHGAETRAAQDHHLDGVQVSAEIGQNLLTHLAARFGIHWNSNIMQNK